MMAPDEPPLLLSRWPDLAVALGEAGDVVDDVIMCVEIIERQALT